MHLNDKIQVLNQVGNRLVNLSDTAFENLYLNAVNQNPWFTVAAVRSAIDGAIVLLNKEKLTQWTARYAILEINPKKVGVIAAGNIPMVGLHDVLCVLLCSHHLMLKMSSKDTVLMQYILDQLFDVAPSFRRQVSIVDRLNDADIIIATGSDNTARYFEYYFKNKPNIIRKNRSSVAILTGHETMEELRKLGHDIFQYFGLGCRNVSKIYVPKGYDLTQLINEFQAYESIIHHHKYSNNYDYNRSIYLVNMTPHLDTGFLLIRESEDLVSPISVLYYQQYESEAQLHEWLADAAQKIQCIVGKEKGMISFGKAQFPQLTDYADGVDVLQFLLAN